MRGKRMHGRHRFPTDRRPRDVATFLAAPSPSRQPVPQDDHRLRLDLLAGLANLGNPVLRRMRYPSGPRRRTACSCGWRVRSISRIIVSVPKGSFVLVLLLFEWVLTRSANQFPGLANRTADNAHSVFPQGPKISTVCEMRARELVAGRRISCKTPAQREDALHPDYLLTVLGTSQGS